MDGFLSICDSKTPHWIESVQLPELKHNKFCVLTLQFQLCFAGHFKSLKKISLLD
jgi:hypothetical protein